MKQNPDCNRFRLNFLGLLHSTKLGNWDSKETILKMVISHNFEAYSHLSTCEEEEDDSALVTGSTLSDQSLLGSGWLASLSLGSCPTISSLHGHDTQSKEVITLRMTF